MFCIWQRKSWLAPNSKILRDVLRHSANSQVLRPQTSFLCTPALHSSSAPFKRTSPKVSSCRIVPSHFYPSWIRPCPPFVGLFLPLPCWITPCLPSLAYSSPACLAYYPPCEPLPMVPWFCNGTVWFYSTRSRLHLGPLLTMHYGLSSPKRNLAKSLLQLFIGMFLKNWFIFSSLKAIRSLHHSFLIRDNNQNGQKKKTSSGGYLSEIRGSLYSLGALTLTWTIYVEIRKKTSIIGYNVIIKTV